MGRMTQEQVRDAEQFLRYCVDGCNVTQTPTEIILDAGGPCTTIPLGDQVDLGDEVQSFARLRSHTSADLTALQTTLSGLVQDSDNAAPSPGAARDRELEAARREIVDETIDHIARTFGFEQRWLGEQFEDTRIDLRAILMEFAENFTEAHDDWAYQGE